MASFAASSAASRLITFGLRNNKPLRSNALVVGASSYEDLCDRIGKRTLVRPVGYLFTGSDGEVLFRNEKGEVGPSTVDHVLDANVIDDVLMVDKSAGLDPDDILYSSSIRGKTFRTLMRTPLAPAGRYRTQALGAGEFLLTHESVPVGAVPLAVKRLMDIVGAVIGLIVCAIAYVLLARRIKRETHGSVIFRQTRVGRNGRLFTLYKFRTMDANAEELHEELLEQNEMKGHIFKIRLGPPNHAAGPHAAQAVHRRASTVLECVQGRDESRRHSAAYAFGGCALRATSSTTPEHEARRHWFVAALR